MSPFDPKLQSLTPYQMDWAILTAKPQLRERFADHQDSLDSDRVGLLMAWLWDHVSKGAK